MISFSIQVCEVDNADEGMLNSCCYMLILTQFLQTQGLLPVFGSKNVSSQ